MVKKKYPVRQVKKFAKDFVRHLEDKGLKVEKAYLFGSYAKNHARAWSDIDVCVVSRRLARNKDKNETYLWKKVLEIDPRIEPVGYAPEDFDPIDPLVYEIKKYGVEIK